jgi:hypothetical protein
MIQSLHVMPLGRAVGQVRHAVEAVEARLFPELDPNGPKLAIVPKTASPVSARRS